MEVVVAKVGCRGHLRFYNSFTDGSCGWVDWRDGKFDKMDDLNSNKRGRPSKFLSSDIDLDLLDVFLEHSN